MTGRPGEMGFSLLEVMVAIAVLAVAMSAIVGINTGAMTMAAKSKAYTQASMLARSKMIDIEEKIREKGFPDFDETEDGDFSDEGFRNFTWVSEIVKIKLPKPDVSSAAAAADSAGGTGSSTGAAGIASGALGIAPALSANPMITAGLPMVLDQIEGALREVRLTVNWKEGTSEKGFTVTTHIVNIPGAEVGTGVQQVVVPQKKTP